MNNWEGNTLLYQSAGTESQHRTFLPVPPPSDQHVNRALKVSNWLDPRHATGYFVFFNNCTETKKISKLWRQAKVLALLKPGKDPSAVKSFRPIPLICHSYKLFERLILSRIAENVDAKLIPEQDGFRPGKSCTSQLPNLMEHIEDGYEKCLITGAVFVDLSAAYDTVNH